LKSRSLYVLLTLRRLSIFPLELVNLITLTFFVLLRFEHLSGHVPILVLDPSTSFKYHKLLNDSRLVQNNQWIFGSKLSITFNAVNINSITQGEYPINNAFIQFFEGKVEISNIQNFKDSIQKSVNFASNHYSKYLGISTMVTFPVYFIVDSSYLSKEEKQLLKNILEEMKNTLNFFGCSIFSFETIFQIGWKWTIPKVNEKITAEQNINRIYKQILHHISPYLYERNISSYGNYFGFKQINF